MFTYLNTLSALVIDCFISHLTQIKCIYLNIFNKVFTDH